MSAKISTSPKSIQVLRLIENLFLYLLIISGAILTTFPFLWMLLTAFKGPSDVISIPLRWFPTEWRFDNFSVIWKLIPFARVYLNSIIVAVSQTFGVLITSSLAAYSFARIKFWGRDVIFLIYLCTIMIPEWILIIPSFLIIKSFHWLNTYQGLIVPGLCSIMCTFLLRQFFLTIPRDYDEAAYLDGANHFQIYSRIFLPLAKPALLTVGLITFMGSWNSFLWPLTIISSDEMQTLPLALSRFILSLGWNRVEWGALMAATLLSTLPIIVIYAILQNYFIKGIALSGLK